jgi:hypothetical protein
MSGGRALSLYIKRAEQRVDHGLLAGGTDRDAHYIRAMALP